MQKADCPKCAYFNELDDDVVFGNIECAGCGGVFHWSRSEPTEYLKCLACNQAFKVSDMYSVDACCKKHQALLP